MRGPPRSMPPCQQERSSRALRRILLLEDTVCAIFETPMSAITRSLLFFLCFLIVACEDTSAPPPNADVCFTTEIESVIDAGCAKSGCHDEDDIAGDVLKRAGMVVPGNPAQSRLITLLTSTDPSVRMPPPPWPAFDSQTISTITLWIRQGASVSACTTPIDTTTVTYSSHIKRIVDLYCVGCHIKQVSGSGPILTTHARVKDEIINGHFMQTIEHEDGYVPMPPGRTRVSERDVQMLKTWVRRGMP